MAVSQQSADHPVNEDWVDGHAAALWHDVKLINDLLADIENVVRLFEFHGNTKKAAELRQVAGGLRVERDLCKDRATELEMAGK